MKRREKRVIEAFINVVKSGRYSYDEAVTIMEDARSYDYLTDEAKEVFYAEFGKATTEGDETAPDTETI